jgi:C-terminal processing protease CtpA/Prc
MADHIDRVSPEALYDAVWSATYEHFWDGKRLDAFKQWRHRFDGMLYSQDDAHRAINDMLSSLGDTYTWFKLPERLDRDEREATNPESPVHVHCLRGGIALVRLDSFTQRNSAEEMHHALLSVENARGFILDLRGNGGGILGEANTMLSSFMDRGDALKMRYYDDGRYTEESYWLGPRGFEMTLTDRDGNIIGTNNSNPRYPNIIDGRPLFVLIDGKTASAAEFFAATLRDHRLARLFGTATAGKGISQSTKKMPNGTGLQVTNGTFVPPSGQFFGDHKQTVYNGVLPHCRVEGNGRSDIVLDVAYDHMLRELEPRRARSNGGNLLLAGAIGLGLVAFAGTMGGGRRPHAA